MGRTRAKRSKASRQPTPRPTAAASGRWDRLGVWASAACAVHCLATPLLFLLAPAIASVWAHPAAHLLIAAFVLPLAATVLVRGYRLHRQAWVAGAALFGALCILIGGLLPLVPSTGVAHAGPEPAGMGPAGAGAEPLGADPAGLGPDLRAHGARALLARRAHHQATHEHDDCCPQLVVDPSGRTRVDWPAASIVTLVGSAFLVLGHIGNLASTRCCIPAKPS